MMPGPTRSWREAFSTARFGRGATCWKGWGAAITRPQVQAEAFSETRPPWLLETGEPVKTRVPVAEKTRAYGARARSENNAFETALVTVLDDTRRTGLRRMESGPLVGLCARCGGNQSPHHERFT